MNETAVDTQIEPSGNPLSDAQPAALEPAASSGALVVRGEPAETALVDQGPSNLVIVVHASVGSGHRSAANAIAEALRLLASEPDNNVPEDLEVEVLDILDWGRIKFDGDKTASMFVGATRPFYDITWRFTFTGRLLWGGGTIWSRIMFAPFTAYIAKRRPLAIIATHITAANSAVSARMITGQNFPILSVPTDYETEGLWPHRYTDLFCVATESMAETLRARRIEESRIQITGIPTREAFRVPHDTVSARAKYNLPQDKELVLVLAGAYLPRPYLRLRETINKLLPFCHSLENLHLAIVAGNDKDYYDSLVKTVTDLGLPNVTPLGYVEDMAALMSASDLIVCKAGGLTVTECLCANAPMLLVGKAYGQEKINVEMLTGLGAAMRVTTARELLNALRYTMDNPRSIQAMLINAQHIRRPDAARDIALAAIRLATSETPPDPKLRRKHFFHVYIGKRPAHLR